MILGKKINQDRMPTSLLNQLATFPWYDSSMINDAAATANNTTGGFAPGQGPRVELGSWWCDELTGACFQYVKAAGALAVGQVVTPAAPTAGTVTAAGSTTDSVITNITTTASEVGNYIYFWNAAVAGSQSLKLIKGQVAIGANTNFVVSKRSLLTGAATSSSTTVTPIFDADQLSAVPANGSACAVIRPYNVVVNPTTPRVGAGIALGTVTSGNFTIVQIAGIAFVLTKGDVTTTVSGFPVTFDATTAGFVCNTAAAAANVQLAGNMIVAQVASVAGDTAAAAGLYPYFVNFMGSQ